MEKIPTFKMQANNDSIYMRIHHNNYIGETSFHNHEFYEFIFSECGIINQFCNDDVLDLKQNDVCIVKPETIHSVRRTNVSPSVFYNFEVSKKFVRDFLDTINIPVDKELFNEPFLILKYSNSEMKDVMNLLNKALKENATKQESISCFKTIIGNALCRLISHVSSDSFNTFKNPIINNCLAALNDSRNFSETIQNIFSKLGYCHEHITRLFKKEGLSTPISIFLKNKLEYSRILLSSSDLKIIDIVDLCGLYSTSYFYKMFKKYYNVSPSQYRDRYI